MSPSRTAVPAGSPFAPHRLTQTAARIPSRLSQTVVAPPSEFDDDEDDEVETCYLRPAAFSAASKGKWKESGKTLLAAVGPVGGTVAAWVAQSSPSEASSSRLNASERNVYLATQHIPSDPVMTFYTETYTLFTSLQRIVATGIRLPTVKPERDAWDGRVALGPPGAETIQHMRRLVGMYLEELARLRDSEGLPDQRAKFDAAYHIFHLAQVLYLPQDGRGEGLLGEELLDWVNDVDPAPDNSLGNEIMQTRHPYDHPSFFPYITRCLLRGFHLPASTFLRTLSSHQDPQIAKIGILLATHLSLFPRSTNVAQYPLDHQFTAAHQKWLTRFRAEMAGVMKGVKRWEDELRGIVDLMEGNKDRIFEEAADWREAMGAWGILVNISMRRDDLPRAITIILKGLPLEEAILDDRIQSALCSGQILQAVLGCHELDIWLAAHLADVFDKLDMIPDEEKFDSSLRDYFLLNYAEYLQDCPRYAALWRIVADYLSAAGNEGRARLRSHIMHVPLDLDTHPHGDPDQQVEARFGHFTDVREACVELRLDDEWRAISEIMADRLIRRGDYGLGATMCLQAEDGWGLSRIAEKILQSYLTDGPETFLNLVNDLPASLLTEAPLALADLPKEEEPMAANVFATRLAFLAEFRDYLLFIADDVREEAAARLIGLVTSGIAPDGFCAVLLAESVTLLEDMDILITANDTFELMRVLEEVTVNSSFAPEEYLSQLALYIQRTHSQTASKLAGKEAALFKLEEVRLALARNLARAMVVGFDNPF